jgi:TonB family protein
LRSPVRSAATPLPRFIAVSVLVHLVLVLLLPSSLFHLKENPVLTESGMPGEISLLTVMDIAAESFLAGNYSLAAQEPELVTPEEARDLEVEYPDTSIVGAPAVPGESGVATGGAGVGGAGTGGGSGGGRGVLTGQGQYEPPVPVIMMWPRYPASAKRKGIKGTVVVRVHVTAEGTVDQAQAVSGLADEACREAALEAARSLRFLPATLGGEPIDAWFSYPVEFGTTGR